ncbi:MAG: ATP-binding protein [Kofleriaceae bacterium]
MNEVSAKAMPIVFGPLEKKGISIEQFLEGTSVTTEILANKKARIDWLDVATIMKNLRSHYTDDEYVELGREWMRQPGLKFAFVIARLMFSAMDFYRWMNKPRDGVGNQMFSCIVPTHREPAPNEIEMDLEVKDGLPIIWEFFLISKGNMEELPKLLGLPRSEVTITRIPRGARYHIKVPQGRPLFSRIWRFLTRPLLRRDAAKELKAAHESLVERYEELESAQMKLDRQAAQLRTAHSINELVQRDVDVDATLFTVAKALVEEAEFSSAAVTLMSGGASARFGDVSDEATIVRILEARGGENVAELVVTPKPGAETVEREALLAFIMPSLAIALQNAVYRSGLERLVDERTRELREAQSAREKFFGNVSHEIRTPLSIVLLAVGDIEKRARDKMDTRARAALGSIHDSARKLLRLVDELLLLAAGQEGKLKLNLEATNLGGLVTSLVAAWTPATEEAGLTMTANVPAPITAKVDPIAMERVLTNLVSNAVKYTPRGGAVELELVEDADGIRISVLDSGKGISDELMGRLFGRFERAEGEHRKITGTGIGLSLVKDLVEKHGGTVEALRRDTGGTEMRVRLPASLLTTQTKTGPILRLVEHIATPSVAAPSVSAPSDVAQGTILVAEDDPRLAAMIADLLSDEYVVRVANDGASALELAKQYQPNLLITDVDMPIMDGIELSKRFREVMNDRLAPIIILSAVLDLGTRVAGLDAGAVDYVTKPFDPTELRARVRSQFRQRELAIRLHRAEQLSTLSVLTSGLAHELRNPANGVINAIEPLKMLMPPELMKPGEPIGELLDVVGECAAQINTLSKQLLGFRDHETSLQLRDASIREIVDRAASISRAALEGVEIRVDVPPEVRVRCAPPLLTQIFTNLFENGAHAAGNGGWVSVSTQVTDDHVSIIVGDSGPGVPVAMRTKIFEPFFTTKPQGVGTGLGLPVSREIALRHGGALDVHDRGTTSVFVVQLPRHTPMDAAARVG